MSAENPVQLPVCPLCLQPAKKGKAKLLYEIPVCRKCYYAFTNRRQGAFIIDRLLWQLMMLALGFSIGMYTGASHIKLTPDQIRLLDLLAWPLFILFVFKDGFFGYSPGKWLCGVQVIDRTTRQPAGFIASFKRNVLLFIPFFPLVMALQLSRGKRIGDGWANTMTIWKKHEASRVFGARGNCEVCQYNLLGNQSGICPECGTPVSSENRRLFESAATPSIAALPVPISPASVPL